MIFFEIVVFCICYATAAQAQNPISESSLREQNSRWDEVTASHQAFIEASNLKRDKFSCVLKLLKDALAEELQSSKNVSEDKDQANVITSFKNMMEEKQALENNETQLEKPIDRNDDENCLKNELMPYQNAVSEIVPEVSYSQNDSNDQNRIEMPTMMPIFKPRPQPVKDYSYNLISADKSEAPTISTSTRQMPISKSFVPEKIIQTNMSPIPITSNFEIPCQRAADVLDMNIGIPKEAVCRNIHPVTKVIDANIPKQISSPVTLSCADEDTVAMLFKPKNITLQQVYGNLLKKVTITILVPYHMSKLG